ncbi:hypothetical protein CXF80_18300 [Shewanella sp. Actino-trap-3]|jgi:hypothetical protein|uniref:copper resistance protein CopC n=1 Tax=Shewanella sp. Actino-trap-3 TaxID=2058331 RepID=UPI000C32DA9C|nr:copper resistance protein CopC [Shewanella sp. Actino-trap-3]PKG80093.1 hypothetical protein CXF80_18300 [Shewanella sp. Actino-trap-3]
MTFYNCFGLFLLTMLAFNRVSANELSPNDRTVTDRSVAVEFIMAPASIMKISFDEAVILTSMTIKDNDGYLINLGVQVPKGEHKAFSFEIPKLAPADYLILWRIYNHDNSIQQGDIKLTIPDDDIYPRPSTKTHKYGILHKKLHH